MRYATVFAAAAAATLIMAVAPGTSALADRDDRARYYKYSYDNQDRADARRAHQQRKWRRAHYSRNRGRYAYPWGPWGPFAYPPGL
jgi:hypothetical protein